MRGTAYKGGRAKVRDQGPGSEPKRAGLDLGLKGSTRPNSGGGEGAEPCSPRWVAKEGPSGKVEGEQKGAGEGALLGRRGQGRGPCASRRERCAGRGLTGGDRR